MEARTNSYVYGIDRHTLSLTSIHSGSEQNRFALGTLGVKETSEIHVVDFDADEFTLASLVYKCSGGIRALASTPWDASQLLVVSGGQAGRPSSSVSLVRLPDLPVNIVDDGTERTAEFVAQLESPVADQAVHKLAVHPVAQFRQAGVVAGAGVSIWDLSGQTASMKTVVSTARYSMDEIEAMAWDPASSSQLATADGPSVRGWDTRSDTASSRPSFTVDYAHNGRVRAINYNPNMPHILATGGDDGCVRLWDTRSLAGPVIDIAHHTHWVYSVEFNPNHDQLVLSAGADGLVNLESVVSVSSAQAVAEISDEQVAEIAGGGGPIDDFDYDEGDEIGKPTDGLVAQFDDHETSVYAAHWSAADPWIFASLSFDGRMVINTVPREEKYKILL
ncbi:phosphatidylserine decarboxylase 1 [Linderina macrospora]|uniref:Phosphatidylserine decarboxylase 1 n=1 Tax=Linderina macrospora TaxID=4868 RepID=A0ACC1J364_9FUNG|nr:phosphatidylserine decarboxylase 1 [Linderina macrospora]